MLEGFLLLTFLVLQMASTEPGREVAFGIVDEEMRSLVLLLLEGFLLAVFRRPTREATFEMLYGEPMLLLMLKGMKMVLRVTPAVDCTVGRLLLLMIDILGVRLLVER